jgi:transposase
MPAGRYVFLDETGSNVAMTRRYGRAPRGRPVYGAVPHTRGKNLTVVGAVSATGGLLCHRALDGGMDAAAFLAFAEAVLIPALRPGEVVVMDNLSSHKTRAVRAAFAAAGVGVVYLPRYSPELNPIELCWAKVKGRLRAVGARTREGLRVAVAEALASVERAEVGRWIRHCGYQASIT